MMILEAMLVEERWVIHIRKNDLSVMASDPILKMDCGGLNHSNEHYPLTSREWL